MDLEFQTIPLYDYRLSGTTEGIHLILISKISPRQTFNFRAFKATVNTSWGKYKCFLRTNFQSLVCCISQPVPSLSKDLLLKTKVHDYQTTSSQTTLRSKRRSFLHFRSEKLYQLVSLLPAQKKDMLQSWSPEVFHIICRS